MNIPSRWLRYLRPMTNAVGVLETLRALPFGTVHDLTGGDPFLVLAPHPDDETLGCGGLMAATAGLGQHSYVRIVTDGAGSHPDMDPSRLKDVRETETRNALAALGVPVAGLAFMGQADGRLPHAGPAFERLAAALVREVEQLGIRTVFATWRHDPHPDHRAVARLAEVVANRTRARLFYYPIWGWTLTDRTWLPRVDFVGFRLDITDEVARKRRAIACHASQFAGDDPHGFTMPAEVRAHFERPVETFVAG